MAEEKVPDNGFIPNYDWIGAPAEFLSNNTLTGGDSSTENLNQWYTTGDMSYVIVAGAMVLLMPFGLAFLYSGLARRKSALTMIFACMGAFAVVIVQWYFWGYSLAFSKSATNGFIGDLKHFGLMYTLAAPSPGSPFIPELLYAFYQMMFCGTTASIIAGCIAERGRVLPLMVFIFFWATLVYCPVACWIWNPNGWAYKYTALDWAGGGPVEIGSGFSALAYAAVLGKRQERMLVLFRPHNITFIVLGTTLLFFGWLGFNGASAFGANLRAVFANFNSVITGAFSAIAWTLLDFRLAKKYSAVGFCSGLISGLVAATPASGFIPLWASAILGVVTGIASNYGTKLKFLLRVDDSLDILTEHGLAGIIGLLFNGLFAANYVIGSDGVNAGVVFGGWIDRRFKQLYVQIAYILAAVAWSFVVSYILALAINYIPGLHLRASDEAELMGLDDDQLGEFAYDYVEVRRDYLAWTSPKDVSGENQEIPPHERHGINQHRDMLSVKPNGSDGSEHTGIGGDRHGVAAMEAEQEKHDR